MSKHSIVHISPTPIVGAPGKIAWAQCASGHDAISVAISDYRKPLKGFFLSKTLMINDVTRSHIERKISQAEIIHIHQYLHSDKIQWLLTLNPKATFIYQVHSPLREGPIYIDRSYDPLIEFKAKLVVGQHHNRFFPNFIHVPNIILDPPSLSLRRQNEKLRVIYSSTNGKSSVGRWNGKHSKKLEDILYALKKLGKIELIDPKKALAPGILMEIRRGCHVSIDDIATGGFHMISLEGLCTGNIVINRADFFGKSTFAHFCDGAMPPFMYADEENISESLLELAESPEKTAEYQQKSYDFFKQYCDPLKLVAFYDHAYSHALTKAALDKNPCNI